MYSRPTYPQRPRRIPDNYSGNAFARDSAREFAREFARDSARESASEFLPERERRSEIAEEPRTEETEEAENVEIPTAPRNGFSRPTTDEQPSTDAPRDCDGDCRPCCEEPRGEGHGGCRKSPPGAEPVCRTGIFPNGIGNEELLLIGLIFLLSSEGDNNLILLLMLLLFKA